MTKVHPCTDSKTPTSKWVLQPENTVNNFVRFTTYAGNLNSPHFRTLQMHSVNCKAQCNVQCKVSFTNVKHSVMHSVNCKAQCKACFTTVMYALQL